MALLVVQESGVVEVHVGLPECDPGEHEFLAAFYDPNDDCYCIPIEMTAEEATRWIKSQG